MDKKFKQLKVEVPVEYREIFNPEQSEWWWYYEYQHEFEKLDWLWNDISLGVFAVAGTILIDTCSKFIFLGPDVVSALILGSHSILAMFAIQGSLTKKGQLLLETIFRTIRLPKYLWKKSQLLFSLNWLLTVMLINIFLLPALSNQYTNQGIIYYEQGQVSKANQKFNRALNIDGNNVKAIYQLGLINEAIDLESAVKYYKRALSGGYAPAYNNLGRILIKQGELSEATAFLLQGLREIQNNYYEGLEYYLLKNLGWVRLEQGRYQEAKTLLESAKQVGGDEKTGVASYCLLAIVKENLHQNPAKEWQICLAYASSINPDEDNWIQKARQFYENNEENNEENWWESLDNSFSDTYSE